MSENLDHEETRVRQALHAARVQDPIPPAVAARLDETLARLADERSPALPTVTDLRRRRRRWSVALSVAAAAIVAAALGPQWFPSIDSHTTSADSQIASSQDSGGAAMSREQNSEPRPEHGSSAAESAAPENDGASTILGSARARFQARRLLRDGATVTDDAALSLPTCAPVLWAHDTRFEVTFDGVEALLLARAKGHDNRAVRIVRCRDGAVLDSFTVSVG